ncbi:MAG: ATP-binding protein [Myxococcota bacterium]
MRGRLTLLMGLMAMVALHCSSVEVDVPSEPTAEELEENRRGERLLAEIAALTDEDATSARAAAERALGPNWRQPRWKARFVNALAIALSRQGYHAEALVRYDEAAAIFEAMGEPVEAAEVRVSSSFSASHLGLDEEAFSLLAKSDLVFQGAERIEARGRVQLSLGTVFMYNSTTPQDLEASLEFFEAALRFLPSSEHATSARPRGMALANSAEVLMMLGRIDEARRLANEAKKQFEAVEHEAALTAVEALLATMDLHQGRDRGPAIARLGAASRKLSEAGFNDYRLNVETLAGEACRIIGDVGCVRHHANEALRWAREVSCVLNQRRSLELLVWADETEGRVEALVGNLKALRDLLASRPSTSLRKIAFENQLETVQGQERVRRASLENSLQKAVSQRRQAFAVAGFVSTALLLGLSVALFRSWRRSRARADRSDAGLAHASTLIAELNHRFGNHLAVLQALARNEARLARTEPADRARGLECIARSIDAIHSLNRLMSEARSLKEEVLLDEVLEGALTLVTEIQSDQRIQWSIAGEPVWVEPSVALNLTLVVVEAVTNAYKHAFPDGRRGTVRVVVGVSEEALRVEVVDDGAGIPSGASKRGLELIRRLASHLSARLDVRSSTVSGTRIALELAPGAWRREAPLNVPNERRVFMPPESPSLVPASHDR